MTAHEPNNQSVPCSTQAFAYDSKGKRRRIGNSFRTKFARMRDFHYQTIQVGMEESSSVSRICGTPGSRASMRGVKIAGIVDATGPVNAVSPHFQPQDYMIQIYDPLPLPPKAKPNGDIIRPIAPIRRFPAAAFAVEHIKAHLHLMPLTGDSFELWDTYDWKEWEKLARK